MMRRLNLAVSLRRRVRHLVLFLRRRHQLSHAADVQAIIDHHERLLANLPTEIRRLHQLRLYHLARARGFQEPRDPVNWDLGRSARLRRLA